MAEPFFWGAGGKRVSSPEAAARQRAIAEALIGRSETPAQNWAQGLADVAAAWSGTQLRNQADEAEQEGQRAVAELLAGLTPESGFSDISAVMANPWATASQSAVAQALMGNQFNRSNIADERAYQAGLLADQRAYDQPMLDAKMEGLNLANQTAQAQLDALLNPPVDPWAGTQVVNDQIIGMGEAGPQVLGDFRTQDQYRQLTPDEVTLRGLDPNKVWQIGPDNKLSEAGGSLVTVNAGGGQQDPLWGDAPKDQVWLRDANGAVITEPDASGRGVRPVSVPISGSQLDADAAAAAAQQDVRAGQRDTATGIITSAAQKARDALHSGALTTGIPGNVAAIDPSSQAAELRRQLGVLTSNATVQNLNAMRAASPTGGALGNVTEREGAMLAGMSGALDPSSPTFETDLDEYERVLLEVIHGPEMGRQIYEQTRPPPRVGQIVNSDDGRYRYLGGDLGNPSSWEKVQ